MEEFIVLEDVHKTYGKGENAFEALKGISLEIKQGEFIALMGPSGSGKSSLANILGTLDVGTKGVYRFCGINVFSLTQNQRALLRRNYIGFIFQGFNLLARTTALENVELPLMYRGIKKDKRKEIALQALERVGLREWADHTSAKLSGGQQQRVAIARAIASKPLFLIADEPTGNLDSKTSADVIGLLKHTNKMFNQTIVMITHNNPFAQLTDRIIRIEDGKIYE